MSMQDVAVSEDLYVVDVFGCPSSHDSVDRNVRLMRKSYDAARRRAEAEEKYVAEQKPRDVVECLCANCGHVFYRHVKDETVCCPYCQTKHHYEEAEELHLTRQDNREVRLEKLLTKEKQQKRKQHFVVFRPLDKHENDAKTQTSLQMGTAAYKEYVQDLQESSPVKPDDSFHVELEARNEALRPEMNDQMDGKSATGDLIERKTFSEAAKRDIHDEARAAALSAAAGTVSQRDDLRLQALGLENALLHDVNISAQDYEAALEDFAKGS